ncbi:hypothetical protein JXB27_02070 [Candidatus Woesearchaeota archaeon]|nr:hypothetical protein [Candidatus Woesearchaeota archaeon]
MSRRENYFEKIALVKQKLMPAIEGLNDKQLRSVICHCSYYSAGRRKILTDKEREIYDLLLSKGFNARTAYNWFCLINVPDHIRQKILKKQISYADAQAKSNAWRRMISTKSGKEIVEQVQNIIGGLEWKNTNHTINGI